MAASLVGAITAGLFVGGEPGLVSFVALLNVTAGLTQSIHSLGQEFDSGVLDELLERTETGSDSERGLDTGRLARLGRRASIDGPGSRPTTGSEPTPSAD